MINELVGGKALEVVIEGSVVRFRVVVGEVVLAVVVGEVVVVEVAVVTVIEIIEILVEVTAVLESSLLVCCVFSSPHCP